MKKKSLSRHSNTTLNLTPHYKANLFDSGGPFANMTTAGLWDDSTKATLNNTGGEGSVGGVFAGVEGMLESGLQNAKLKSTYNIQRNIADNFGQALSNQNLNTNDQLMEAWDQYNPMSHISRKDIRGGSTLGRLWNTNMASIKGAEAGWNTGGGPWGAIIGGVVGLGAGIAGWVTGGRKASRLRDRLNNEIDIANEFGYQNLANQQANVEHKNLLRAEGNYVAYGGPLDKRLAGHQMQDIYGNGIPSANRFAPGGNVNVTVTPNVYTGTDIRRLLPYIQKAKAMREEQQLLKEQEQKPIPIRREVQIPEPSAKYTYTPPTEEIKQQMREYVPSDELIDSILKWEGFLSRPSNKLDGIWTIGYGDTDKELNGYYLKHPEAKMSEKEARERAAHRIRTEFLDYAKRLTPNWDKLTNPQKDAIVSYIYNVGPGAFKNKHPRLQKALRELDYDAIAENLSAGYNNKRMPGLKKRRDFERLAFYYPEMTTYGVIPEGATLRQFESNNSPANKLRYETLGIKQPQTGNVPAMYTLDYLNSLPTAEEKAESVWGFADGGNLFKKGRDVKDPKKPVLDLTLTKETLLNNNTLPTQKDNTKVAILQGEKAEKVLKNAQKEQERRAAVVEKEKLEAIKKGPHNFEATRKLEGFNQKPGYTSEPYMYTDDYNNSRTFIDKLFGLGEPTYPVIEGAGAIELFSPIPGSSVKNATKGVSAAKKLMTRGAYADKKLADLVETRRALDKELKLFDSDPNYVREFPLHWYNDHRVATKKSILDDIYDNTLSQQYILDNYPSHLSYEIPGVDGPLLLGIGKKANSAYKINDLPGYQLKMLMRGNPLEKQVSRSGTVNVNNIRSLANKGSNIEKTVVDKVLNDKFAGQKSIDYNQFRKAVQDELITYNITTDKTLPYSDYGMDRLGFKVERDPAGYSIPGIPEGARADVLLFDSPRIPMGSEAHYNPNTLGHSRTYTTVDEPNILHVMESQSDWAQRGIAKNRTGKILSANEHYPGGFEARRNKAITAAKNDVELWKKMLKTGVAEDGRKLEPSELYQIRTAMLPNAERKLTEIEARFSYVDPQEIYLADNYTSKQIQENLRYAAEKGQTKMRYPTRETAAKIEGYSKERISNPELDKKFWELEDELKRAEQAIFEKYLPQNYIDEPYRDEYYLGLDNIQRSEAFDKSPEAAKMRKELIDVREKINPMKWFRENVPERYLPEHETILRKYDNFPKQYQKLFKGADIRTAVDAKGNSWYEVDVPKDYLNIEWPFKYGGKLKK